MSTMMWEQNHLLRAQNRLLESGGSAGWHPGAQLASVDRSAALGVGF
jgi:hypothetical protein